MSIVQHAVHKIKTFIKKTKQIPSKSEVILHQIIKCKIICIFSIFFLPILLVHVHVYVSVIIIGTATMCNVKNYSN